MNKIPSLNLPVGRISTMAVRRRLRVGLEQHRDEGDWSLFSPPVAAHLSHKFILSLISSWMKSFIVRSQKWLERSDRNVVNTVWTNGKFDVIWHDGIKMDGKASVMFSLCNEVKRTSTDISNFFFQWNLFTVVFMSIKSDFVPVTNVSVLQQFLFLQSCS